MREKGIGYSVKGIVFGFIILISIFLIQPLRVSAQESSSAGMLQIINQIKLEAASKASELKKEVNKKMANKLYAGIISEKSLDRLTLNTMSGDKKITVNQYTIYSSDNLPPKSKKTLGLLDLNNSDFVVALGDNDDNNILTAKKIIKTTPIKVSEKTTVWAIVETVGPKISLKLKDGTSLKLVVGSKTNFYLGNEEANISDAKASRAIIVRGSKNTSGDLAAEFIYITPSAEFIKAGTKESTKSATPSSSVKK